MKATRLQRMVPFLGLILFVAAVGVIYWQLQTYRLHDIVSRVHAIPLDRIGLAVLLTASSYLVMTGYDLLALHYIRHPLPVAKTIMAAFVGYAFSNNIGFSMVAGASVRYRLYSAWGLSGLEITQVVLFCAVSLWMGFCALSGIVCIFEPLELPQGLHWFVTTVRPVGVVLLSVAALYWTMTVWGKKQWSSNSWCFSLPGWRLSTGQLVIAGLDWLMAGAVLYTLMPADVPMDFAYFLGIFLTAQLAGLISQVPGGLGVFESVILLLILPSLSAPSVMGALLAYRGIYYLLPLLAATVVLGAEELFQKRALYQRIRSFATGALEALFIPLLSLAVFVAGAIMMFSGALPAIPDRLEFLSERLPLPFFELSHFLSSLVGMGLLLLARGLQRRLDGAYGLTVGLLGLGIVASLLKGLDYEEASILAVILAVLLPCRRFFFRRASLLSERFTPAWLAAIATVVISTIGLGLFAYRHVEYRHELWWHFSSLGEAPRFLRATVGSMGVALGFGLARLLRPAPYRPPEAGGVVSREIVDIVRHSPSAEANLALLGDKQFFFNENRQAFIMYGVAGHAWIAMGDPVGPEDQWAELLWRFQQAAHDYGDRAVFYQVGHEHLHLYLDIGLTLLKLGEVARVPLSTFSLEGGSRKKLRYIQRKLTKEGCSFEIVDPGGLMTHMDTLEAISDGWLKEKNTREKGFSLGFFDPAYLQHFPVALVRHQGAVVAFTNIWSGDNCNELSVDLMRHRPDAPNGVMDYLFIEIMLWARTRGYHWFNLGMAPLSGMEARSLAPLWHRVGGWVAHVGDHFYNFQGLRDYKQKFNPVWQPKYLAAPGGLSLPRTLADIGALISGGLKGIMFK